jgi:hypothetical protein
VDESSRDAARLEPRRDLGAGAVDDDDVVPGGSPAESLDGRLGRDATTELEDDAGRQVVYSALMRT